MRHRTLIVWFRRDLRLADQAALYHALQDAEQVVPLFILDPALLAPPHAGNARLAFLLASLQNLDGALRTHGSMLVLRHGDPATVLVDLLHRTDAAGVYWNRDYVWPGRSRDAQVCAVLQEWGAVVRTFADQVLVEPDSLLTAAGRPYAVFTPYRTAWSRLPMPPPLPGPVGPIRSPDVPAQSYLLETTPGRVLFPAVPPAGEAAGRALLARFITESGPLAQYAACRNFPALEGTSRLSPHLRFGTIGVRTAYHAAQRAGPGDGPTTWIAQLAWRDFYHQWVWHHPQVLTRSFDSACDDLAWENRTDLFEAWCRGTTGFPIVDAAMRQLNATGWMHNRLRMIAAGFLCKDLLCDWRWGEAYFWDRLVDADKPANVGGWQWCASTGADPQPYFRVFNPATQSKRFDPDGRFIRAWVPEVRRLPDRYLHVPAELPPVTALSLGFRLDRDYPAPIVDHVERRARALDMYAVARRGRRHAGE